MYVPNAAHAVIPDAKITDYLLKNPGKAYFFLRFRFTLAQWHELRDALLRHIVTHEYAQEIVVDDGVKYVVEGELQSPDGKDPPVR